MTTHLAAVQCPVCEDELETEAHHITDWKRGSVQIELVLTDNARTHLADHGDKLRPSEEPGKHADAPPADENPEKKDEPPADPPAPKAKAPAKS